MLAFIKKIRSRLQSHGVGYFALVARTEIAQPRFRATRHIRALLIPMRRLGHRGSSGSATWAEDCLQFVYDLSTSPITFDFASYLAAAEIERRLRGLAAR
jgi:hypothetical protein